MNRGASCVRKIFTPIITAKFPRPMCTAIPMPRLHCPARLFPSLHICNSAVSLSKGIWTWRVPRNGTGEWRKTARDTQECSKVLQFARGCADLDWESDENLQEPREDEREADAQFVRVVAKEQSHYRCFFFLYQCQEEEETGRLCTR